MNNEQYEKAPSNEKVIKVAEEFKPIIYNIGKKYPGIEVYETPYENVAYARLLINENGKYDCAAVGLNPRGELGQKKIDYLRENAGKTITLESAGVWGRTITAIKRIAPDLRYLYMLDIVPIRTPSQKDLKDVTEKKLKFNLGFIQFFFDQHPDIHSILLSTGRFPDHAKTMLMQKQQTIIKNNRSKICFSVINKDGSFKNLGQRSINIISYADLVQGLQEKYEIHSEETDLTDVDLKFEDGYIIYSDGGL